MKKKKLMNMNDFAMMITYMEGKKISVSQGQVKEILSCIKDLVTNDPLSMKIFMNYLVKDMGLN